jgi:hypothetical protein
MHNHFQIKQFMILDNKEIYLIVGKHFIQLMISIIKLFIILISVIVEFHQKVKLK